MPQVRVDQLVWMRSAKKMVGMRISNTVHYSLDTAEAAEEFSKLLPSGGHLIHLDPDKANREPENHTVTLFHQLRCLDIIRQEYIGQEENSTPSTMTHHCMNYLRQTIMCHPNLRLESVRFPTGPKSTTTQIYDAVCDDWREVYVAAENNYKTYTARR
ncbi:hypothetical protein NEOLEDRAFT_1138941 [Neolentinus lepideus HHB14362 ss-1]|uniref:Uncharacterized protein n=1 Tax=Neolentinus lepideus HHB14362 ss-1 TaxID=1314782 RepID=A0A165Q0H9_9AGAM|nr:hypothetical protein NEOLEDRAFT_1138941 [Neolentinus lepideus HHB14362 ss-1]